MKEMYECRPFLPLTVPLDYDQSKFLWLEWEGTTNVRNLKYYDFYKQKDFLIKTFAENEGEVSLACLIEDGVVYVENRRNIKIVDLSTGKQRHFLG